MSAMQFDCLLAVDENNRISATYVDLYDSNDTARDDALVDPFGDRVRQCHGQSRRWRQGNHRGCLHRAACRSVW